LSTRLFVLVFGVVYIILGVLGFIPALGSAPAASAPHVAVTNNWMDLFGFLPTNLIENIAYIVLGVFGVLLGATLGTAVGYSRLLFVIFGLATVAGFMPQADTLWGAMPLYSPNTWLHVATALVAAYFGWVAQAETYVAPVAGHVSH